MGVNTSDTNVGVKDWIYVETSNNEVGPVHDAEGDEIDGIVDDTEGDWIEVDGKDECVVTKVVLLSDALLAGVHCRVPLLST
jgi:hypothetical protein